MLKYICGVNHSINSNLKTGRIFLKESPGVPKQVRLSLLGSFSRNGFKMTVICCK